MTTSHIPAKLITGATGAGKSRAVLRLLEARPREERWAVLVNDFGAVSLSTAAADNVIVREVSGCICCSAQVMLRTALVALVRNARPHRLLVEAAALARPAAILNLLHEPGIAKTVRASTSVCVVAARQLADPRLAATEVYREQIGGANIVLLDSSGAHLHERDHAREALGALRAPGSRLIERYADLTLSER